MNKRLDLIVSFVDEKKIVCDVGTDHGITALKIYEEKNPKKVIATDISENSLKKLRDKLEVLSYDIKTIVTDGIEDLDIYNPDIIIISGMGGYLISQIIERGMDVAKKSDKLILQANNSLSYLRRFLLDNSFVITDEKIAYEDDIYYDIIVCSYNLHAKRSYDKSYFYEYGKHNIEKKDPLLKEKLDKEKHNLLTIKKQIDNINTSSSKKRMDEIKDKLSVIDEVLGCL